MYLFKSKEWYFDTKIWLLGERQFCAGLSHFCAPCEGGSPSSLFWTPFSRVFVKWMAVEDRDNVFLQSKGQVCLLSSIIKIMFLSGANVRQPSHSTRFGKVQGFFPITEPIACADVTWFFSCCSVGIEVGEQEHILILWELYFHE